jgi:hypothetical protein
MDGPSLPGTPAPADRALPLAWIYQPEPSAMQSALAQRTAWVLEFEPGGRREPEPLMGWTSTRYPFGSMSRLHFPNLQAAVAFAERHGWQYLVRDPPLRCFRPKSYADNFK